MPLPRKAIAGLAVSALCGVCVLAGCWRPLPEEGSPSADLYRRRCGTCHRAYQPSSMKYALWAMVLPRMEDLIRKTGGPSLSEEERVAIEAYLRRNAG
jgi:hypothetical protein